MIPAVDRSTASESRNVASSSTICTQRSYGIIIRSIDLQLNQESGPLRDNRPPPEVACVLLYNLQAQRQTEPHSSRLRSLVGLEQSVHHLRCDAGTIVFDLDDDAFAAPGDAHDHKSACVRALRSRVNRVGDEVVQNLLDLDPVRPHKRDSANVLNLDMNAACGCLLSAKRPDLQGEIRQIQRLQVQFAARDEIPDALQRRSPVSSNTMPVSRLGWLARAPVARSTRACRQSPAVLRDRNC